MTKVYYYIISMKYKVYLNIIIPKDLGIFKKVKKLKDFLSQKFFIKGLRE
jgi:hypothetical protein